MTDLIALTDLPPEIQSKPTAALMVAGANGQAARVAPCLVAADPAPSAGQLSEAKLLLLGAIVRWTQQGASGVQQQTAGPFTVGVTGTPMGYRLWPSEITGLQAICSGDDTRVIGSIDTARGGRTRDYSPGSDYFFGAS